MVNEKLVRTRNSLNRHQMDIPKGNAFESQHGSINDFVSVHRPSKRTAE